MTSPHSTVYFQRRWDSLFLTKSSGFVPRIRMCQNRLFDKIQKLVRTATGDRWSKFTFLQNLGYSFFRWISCTTGLHCVSPLLSFARIVNICQHAVRDM